MQEKPFTQTMIDPRLSRDLLGSAKLSPCCVLPASSTLRVTFSQKLPSSFGEAREQRRQSEEQSMLSRRYDLHLLGAPESTVKLDGIDDGLGPALWGQKMMRKDLWTNVAVVHASPIDSVAGADSILSSPACNEHMSPRHKSR